MTLSGRQLRPTSNDHQTPHEIKKAPVIAPPGGGVSFSNNLKPWPPQGYVVASREPDQAPRVTFSANPNIRQPAEPRPVYRAVASITVTEAARKLIAPDRLAKIDRKRQQAEQPSMAQAMKAAMTPDARERYEATQQKAAALLQTRTNNLEDALRQVHAVKRKV